MLGQAADVVGREFVITYVSSVVALFGRLKSVNEPHGSALSSYALDEANAADGPIYVSGGLPTLLYHM